MGSGLAPGIPTPLLLLALSTLHPIIGELREPLLIVEGPERDGIRLRCLPARPLPPGRLLWSDGHGRDLPAIPEAGGSPGSSALLRPGSGNAAACRAQLGQGGAQSAVVIAGALFPSPWPRAPLLLLLLLALGLALAAALRLRRDRRVVAQEHFRRAQSHAAALSLDERCSHPALLIRGRSRILRRDPGSRPCPGALAVAREGFSRGKHYWEVELGDGGAWELGVLREEIRDSIRDSLRDFPEEEAPGLTYSQGEFRLPGGKLERNSGRCRVLGVLLDQERCVLEFFDAEEKQLLGSVPLKISGNLFPFFRPGSDGNGLGIRPVGV
ncbi:butyrophilin subfamily 2 member A2-like [Vidua chalybeata]|uniref:butyrophilin subfamily 2 member A2-like n=1 Tax=Vidua chalybeata TaxID=81927 RepID=UPI0023A9016A|nr:butyrophilin subfamily 2 member A2-like [Vidua chalybeata]